MFPQIIIFIIKYISFICIDNMCALIFITSFMLPSVSHMHMSMYEELRTVLLYQLYKYLNSLMWQISSVIDLICRSMCDQNVKTTVF